MILQELLFFVLILATIVGVQVGDESQKIRNVRSPPPCQSSEGCEQEGDAYKKVSAILRFLGACGDSDDCTPGSLMNQEPQGTPQVPSLCRDFGCEDQFVNTLEEMMNELEKMQNSPSKEILSTYSRRIDFLKGLMDTNKMTSPVEKVVASQHLCPVPDTISKETHHKTVTKYSKELRDELLGDTDGGLRQRQAVSTGEDMDTLLKNYHKMQENISDNMVILARNMKEKSQLAGEIIKSDIEVVNKSSALTEKNFAQLRVESDRLQEHSRRAWKCWLWVMLAVVIIIFINMVLFMKVMKKRSF